MKKYHPLTERSVSGVNVKLSRAGSWVFQMAFEKEIWILKMEFRDFRSLNAIWVFFIVFFMPENRFFQYYGQDGLIVPN